MSKILLTGATGFVGQHILKRLQERGCHMRLVIREGSQSRISSMQGIESIVTSKDIFQESSPWWAETCNGIETVIHAAWYAEPGQYLQSDKNLDCLLGTINLAKGATTASIKKFIGIGTCFEYEMSDTPLSTRTSLDPKSIYAATKASAYNTLAQYFLHKKINFLWCRLFYLYGEGEDPRRFIPYLHKQIGDGNLIELSKGGQIRDFMDISLASEEIVNALFLNIEGPLNICSGIPVSIREMAEKIADQYNARGLLRFGVRPENLVDPPYVVGIKEPYNY